MECAVCAVRNDATHKFCSECGAPLSAVCPACGHSNEPSHKFCSECGSGLQVPAAVVEPTTELPLQEERRLVTSLFVDLVGFTSFSEARDPEEVRAILTRYFDRSSEIIGRFGGVVDKYIGDAITAFWGSRVAQDDDAELAVRAALELVRSVGELGSEIGVPDLALRAGVLTGETAVGPGGNEKGLVLGDVVNTASRLQSIAAPGTVAVGETTVRLTERAIDYEPLGDKDLKGKSEPVPVWRALRVAAARGGRGRAEGIDPPFVGREDELRMLKDALHATGRDSRARLVSVIGEGGIGKSRISWELQKYIDGLVEPVFWHSGRSPSHAEGLTFWALGEMVRQRAGIAETDDQHRSHTRLRTAVAEYVPDVDEQRWIEPRLAGLLGLADMPEGDRTELYAALRTFFQRVADRGTTVLVFEDMHSADPGLLAFVEELAERSQRHPILVVTLARPELLDREPGWGAARRSTVSFHLGPLTDTQVGELVAGAVPGIPDGVVGRIVERSAGVPLYAVELIRMLLAQGDLVASDGRYRMEGEAATLAIPTTLQSVIGARLDRLSVEERALIQDAAVLGQSFSMDGLATLSGESIDGMEGRLHPLVKRELLEVNNDPRSPELGQYHFVQSLIREVAYSRLTLVERRARHVRVAEHYERVGAVELASLVASHFMSAYEATPQGPEAEELAGRAARALRSAAHRAADLHSHQQVLDLCEKGLAITGEGPAHAELLDLAARAANGLLREETAVEFARMALDWQTEHGDEKGRVRAATLLGTVLIDHARPLSAIEVLLGVVGDHELASTPEETRFIAALSRALMLTNKHAEAADVAEKALVAAERSADMPVLIDLLNTRGAALHSTGRPQEGIALLTRALELAEQNELPLAALRAHNNLGVAFLLDDSRAGKENARAAYDKALALGDPGYVLRTAFFLSIILVDEGRYDEVLAMLGDLDLEDMPPYDTAFLGTQLARIEIVRGDKGAGLVTAREAMLGLSDSEDPQTKYFNDTVMAWLKLLERDFDAAYEMSSRIQYIFGFPDHLMIAALASMWSRDLARFEAVADLVDEFALQGRLVALFRDLVAGGLAALRGDVDTAASVLRTVIQGLAHLQPGEPLAMVRLSTAMLLGYDHPDGRAAADAAAAWIEEVGAKNLAVIWAEGMPPVAGAAATGS